MAAQCNALVFYVNGVKVVDKSIQPEWTLLFYLRNKLGLTGTKLGCGEGGCGACTVMISRYDRPAKQIRHLAANACLTPVCALHGWAVTTVEGIGVDGQGGRPRRLHAVQERLAKAHGSQCGFCTPGFVMSMYTLLRNTSLPTMAQVEEGFQGNLCRCTGYRPILEGCRTFTREGCSGPKNGGCCMDRASSGQNDAVNGGVVVVVKDPEGDQEEAGVVNGYKLNRGVGTSLTPTDFEPYEPSQEPIFPPELQLSDAYDRQYLVVAGERVTWYRPTQLDQLLELKSRFPHAKLIVGNTEVALEMKFKYCDYPVLIHPVGVDRLQEMSVSDDGGVVVGGSVTLTNMENELRHQMAARPAHETRVFTAICQMLHWFAGKQIRNCASVAGNIMTGSPISDLNPLFMAAGCRLTLQSKDAVRCVVMDHQFFTGYRKNIVRPEEVLLSITLPSTMADEFFFGYKQSRRREDDIAIVNAGCYVRFDADSSRVAEARLAFGGMAPTTVMALETMRYLIGRRWEEPSLVEDTCRLLLQDLPLSPSAPGGMSTYRQSLCLSFFFKFYLSVGQWLQQRGVLTQPVAPDAASAVADAQPYTFKSTQLYELVADDQPAYDPVGRPLPHAAASLHVSGAAVYCDDVPALNGELYMSLVLSTKAHAEIVSIDASAALELAGVHAFFSAKDLAEGHNRYGPIVHDDQVFAAGKVTCYGQVIGCVVAETQALAQRARRLIHVEYRDLQPVIVTIDDAIRHGSFYEGFEKAITSGDVERGFAEAEHTLESTFQMAGQEHFYLETQAVIVVPKGENDELELICSTQNPTEVQMCVAEVLGLPANRVVCRVKRMGGGFGGKETRGTLVALPAAVAAHRLQKPIRCMLDRDEDMILTGTRHPFKANYKVGFNADGRLVALDVQLYNNAGNTMDLSCSIMERALFHIDNAYKIPNLRVQGSVCRTNLPSNTAFRGFGGPQGMVITEEIVTNVATYLGMDPVAIRTLNMYREGDLTHFNQTLDYCTLSRCWQQCLAGSLFDERRSQVDLFNSGSRWKKRGLAIVPTKFGIAFTALFLNQAGALVHIYKDGSVLLTHAGAEMGQGLHTKMIQVASRVLGIPHERIFLSETSTDKVPNTSPTAASAGSDLNGMAVLNACQTLMQRLEPIRLANPKGTWNDWIQQAYFQRISLSTTGFYRTPDIGYDFKTNSGRPFGYFTFGAACSEVEIDCLTGDHKVLRTDIVMDLGESINPAIDIGQIEGGFTQGLGLLTLEEPMFAPNGFIVTRGPSNYKIPTADDMPVEFNVSLLRGCPNPRAVFSSKAVGEPPLFLASSVFFAIKDGVTAARRHNGVDGIFPFNAPATAERIRMACEDHLTQKVEKPEPGTYTPWAVSV